MSRKMGRKHRCLRIRNHLDEKLFNQRKLNFVILNSVGITFLKVQKISFFGIFYYLLKTLSD